MNNNSFNLNNKIDINEVSMMITPQYSSIKLFHQKKIVFEFLTFESKRSLNKKYHISDIY